MPTKENIKKMHQHFGFDTTFARADVMNVTGLTATPASNLIRKMKDLSLIEGTESRGKYKFVETETTSQNQ